MTCGFASFADGSFVGATVWPNGTEAATWRLVEDTSDVPLGERILQSVLAHVVAIGDAAEASYFEAKSTVDITSKPGLVKVKLLLACTNRLPEAAARHLS